MLTINKEGLELNDKIEKCLIVHQKHILSDYVPLLFKHSQSQCIISMNKKVENSKKKTEIYINLS